MRGGGGASGLLLAVAGPRGGVVPVGPGAAVAVFPGVAVAVFPGAGGSWQRCRP